MLKDFDGAQSYADKAETLAPANPDVARLKDDIQLHKERAEQERLYLILEDGRKQVMDGNCVDALPFYQQYLDLADPNDQVRKRWVMFIFVLNNIAKHWQYIPNY